MQRKLTQEEIKQHDQVYREGCRLAGPYILTGTEGAKHGLSEIRQQLEQARLCFEKALSIVPNNWASMWALGKIHQRLDQHPQALSWFRKAAAIAPNQPDVLNEAGIEAMQTGNIEEAVNYLQTAASINPDNAGYHANLAMALLINGQSREAKSSIKTSLSLEPADCLSQRISDAIDRFLAGSLRQPRSIEDFM